MLRDEPFGAMLWRSRTERNIPLCGMAHRMALDVKTLVEYELGWRVPRNNPFMLFCFAWMYGLSGEDDFKLLKTKADEAIHSGPVDLSEYLGIDRLPFSPKSTIPVYASQINQKALIRLNMSAAENADRRKYELVQGAMEQKPALAGNAADDYERRFRRVYVDVAAVKLGNTCEMPKEILWKNGKRFPIDDVMSAVNNAALLTGGIGTRYICQIRGQQRLLCMEDDHRWFVESEK